MGELVKFPESNADVASVVADAASTSAQGGARIVAFRHVDVGMVVETVRVLRLIDDRTLLDTFNRRTAR